MQGIFFIIKTSLAVFLVVVASCLSSSPLFAVTEAASQTNNFIGSQTTNEYHLKDNWKMFSSEKPQEQFTVQVPTTIMGGLIANNYYDFDLYQSENLKRVNGTMFAVPWVFETTFSLSEDDWSYCTSSSVCSIRLLFHGINYNGNLTVNDKMIAGEKEFVGALRRFEFDITDLIDLSSKSKTENNKIHILTSLKRPGGADRTFWRNPSLDLSIDFLDWNPSPPDLDCGPYRPVRLLVVRGINKNANEEKLLRFDGFVVDTTIATSSRRISSSPSASPQNQPLQDQFLIARLNVSFWIKNIHKTKRLDAGSSTKVFVNLGKINNRQSLINQDVIVEKSLPFSLEPGEEKRIYFPWSHFPDLTLTENPPLWWPFQMGEQRLFNATVGFDDKPVENWRYGIRSSHSRATRGGSYQLMINNAPMLIRGGGYDPDLFMRIDNTKSLVDEISMIRSMGLNAVRLEGMMMSEEFFDQLDEVGIITAGVGIACCDAWQNWSFWEQPQYFIANETIKTQMRRLAPHPSAALFMQSSDDLPPEKVEIMYTHTMKSEAWPNAFTTSAAGWYSNVSGSSMMKMNGCYSWIGPGYFLTDPDPHHVVGDKALQDRSFGQAYGFLSEGSPGGSPSTLNSWNRTIAGNKSELWDPKLGPLSSVMSFHCGSPVGHFANLSRFTEAQDARYGRSDAAAPFFYRGQVSTLEGIRAQFEGYSRQKASPNNFIQGAGNSTGIITWQISSRWTRLIWTLYDFYHVAHGGFFGAKHGTGARTSGLHVMMSPVDGTISLLNSWYIDFFDAEVTVTVDVFAFNEDGNTMRKDQQGTMKLVWTRSQKVHSVPSDSAIPLDELTVPCDNAEAATLANGGNNTYFVRISWNSSLPDLNTNWDKNWYWLSPKMDVIGPWEKILFYYTPYLHYANMTQLNTLPPIFSTPETDQLLTMTVVPVETASLGIESFRDMGARYYFEKGVSSLDKEGVILRLDLSYSSAATAVAFFIQLRIVDQETGYDFTPSFFDDNFFTLAPGEHRTVLCELPTLGNDLSTIESRIRIEVESYNDMVSQNERHAESGKRKIIEKFTTLVPQKLPPSLRPPTMPASPSRQQPTPSPQTTPSPSGNNNNNTNGNNDDTVSKKEYLGAVIGAAITSLIAVIATFFAFKYRSQALKNGGGYGNGNYESFSTQQQQASHLHQS